LLSTPKILQGFHATPKALNTDKKWIMAVIAGDVFISAKSTEANGILMDAETADELKFFCQRRLQLGQWRGVDCEVWDLVPKARAAADFKLVELRGLLVSAGDNEFTLACRGVQLLDWHSKHRFCGSCGEAMQNGGTEHAMRCDPCNISNYPRISPCIIVVVTRGEHCLLARQPSWPEGRFSTLAGFVEAGESAEQALHREVFEEVGVEVGNVRYVGSQSWPFPGQLMLGFIAEALTDEIVVDGVEISEAHWCHYDDLPEYVPPPTIMAGRLIKQFVDEVSGG
jgi:NAD+ diphosphatase